MSILGKRTLRSGSESHVWFGKRGLYWRHQLTMCQARKRWLSCWTVWICIVERLNGFSCHNGYMFAHKLHTAPSCASSLLLCVLISAFFFPCFTSISVFSCIWRSGHSAWYTAAVLDLLFLVEGVNCSIFQVEKLQLLSGSSSAWIISIAFWSLMSGSRSRRSRTCLEAIPLAILLEIWSSFNPANSYSAVSSQ